MELRSKIKRIMAAQQYTTYAEIVRRTQVNSIDLGLETKIQSSTESFVMRKWEDHNEENGRDQNKKENIWLGSNKTFPTCHTCNKQHLGSVFKENEVCYNCGKTVISLQNVY